MPDEMSRDNIQNQTDEAWRHVKAVAFTFAIIGIVATSGITGYLLAYQEYVPISLQRADALLNLQVVIVLVAFQTTMITVCLYFKWKAAALMFVLFQILAMFRIVHYLTVLTA